MPTATCAIEVDERTLADGSIRTPVDPARSARPRSSSWTQGAESVAITFINAYANAENERRALAAVREVWPNDFVTASHEVLSEIREFERSSTAAINAYLQPVVASYIGKLEAALATQKFPGQLHIVQSNGGIMSTATARKLPVRTALSGPAAGVVAGAAHRQGLGLRQSHHLRSRRHLVRRLASSPAARSRSRRRPPSISAWSSARR